MGLFSALEKVSKVNAMYEFRRWPLKTFGSNYGVWLDLRGTFTFTSRPYYYNAVLYTQGANFAHHSLPRPIKQTSEKGKGSHIPAFLSPPPSFPVIKGVVRGQGGGGGGGGGKNQDQTLLQPLRLPSSLFQLRQGTRSWDSVSSLSFHCGILKISRKEALTKK